MNARDKYDILNLDLADPFGVAHVKGLTTKTMEPLRKLSQYAEELVSNYAKFDRHTQSYDLSLTALSEPLQNELVALYIEAQDREIEYACYGLDESPNSSFLTTMLAMLADDNRRTRENFAEAVKKNLLDYYAKSLQRVLDDACATYLNNSMDVNGFHSQRDLETGEIIWTR